MNQQNQQKTHTVKKLYGTGAKDVFQVSFKHHQQVEIHAFDPYHDMLILRNTDPVTKIVFTGLILDEKNEKSALKLAFGKHHSVMVNAGTIMHQKCPNKLRFMIRTYHHGYYGKNDLHIITYDGLNPMHKNTHASFYEFKYHLNMSLHGKALMTLRSAGINAQNALDRIEQTTGKTVEYVLLHDINPQTRNVSEYVKAQKTARAKTHFLTKAEFNANPNLFKKWHRNAAKMEILMQDCSKTNYIHR